MDLGRLTLGDADWAVLSDYDGRAAFMTQLYDGIIAAVADVCGADAARRTERAGLGQIHCFVDPDASRNISNAFLAQNQEWLEATIHDVAVRTLGITEAFAMHRLPTMRLVFPYAVARTSSVRLNDYLAGIAGPVQSPNPEATAVYHGNLPVAAWTHGPHVDSWWGQPFGGINLWFAVAGINRDNSLFFYDQAGKATTYDHLDEPPYVLPGTALPVPSYPFMADGDLLLFDPEILHATHVNVSDQTRVSLAIRLNNLPLTFSANTCRRHDDWLYADASGRRAISPLDQAIVSVTASGDARLVRPVPVPHDDISEGIASGAVTEGHLRCAVVGATPIVLTRWQGRCVAYINACPHLGNRLDEVPLDDGHFTCATHGLRFSVKDGHASCGDYSLTVVPVEETDGIIRVKI